MEKKIETFEDLFVWQKGIALVKITYTLTLDEKFKKDFALRDQIRRAVISIPNNIAEGFERSTRREYLQFLNFAKGSAGEVRSLLRVCFEIDYIDFATYEHFRNSVLEISRYLSNQIKSLKRIQ